MVRIACLGLGWSGILSALFIVKKYPHIEIIAIDSSHNLGGLMRSETIDGFTFDIGGSHVIFSRRQSVLKEITSFLNGNLLFHERRAFVLFNDTFVPYPFENGVYVLSPELRAELIADYVVAQLELSRNPKWRPCNFMEWLIKVFGKSIAQNYLIPYNEKIWKRPLDRLSADWVFIPGRLPQPDVRSLIRSAAGIPTIGYIENSYFYYPARGGIQALYNSVLNKLEHYASYIKIVVGERVEKIKQLNGEIVINDKYRVDGLISTIPLPELVKAMDAPEDVIKAAMSLDYNQVVVVGIALNKEAPNQHWIYVPQKEVVFHRYAWLSNYSPYNAPQGKSSVIAEITLPKGHNVNLDKIMRKTIEDFVKLGIFSEKDVLFAKAWLHKYGYPVYTLNHMKKRSITIGWIEEQGIKTIGRWGQWHYWNMDKVFEEVKKLIDTLTI